jgi:hypothetical protein
MKALVYHGPGEKSWTDAPDPQIQNPTDIIVRIDTTTICGTDLHILKGDVPAVTPGRILGRRRTHARCRDHRWNRHRRILRAARRGDRGPAGFVHVHGRRLPRHDRRSLSTGARRDRDRDQSANPGSRGDRRWAEDALERFWPRASRRYPGLVIRSRRRRARDAHTHRRAGTSRARGRRPGDTPTLPHRHNRQPPRVLHAHRGGQIEAAWAVAARGKVQ